MSLRLEYGATPAATINSTTDPVVNCGGAAGVLVHVVSTSSLTIQVQVAADGSNYTTTGFMNAKTGVEYGGGITFTVTANDLLWVPTRGAEKLKITRQAGSGTLSFRPIFLNAPPTKTVNCHSFIADGTDENLISAGARYAYGIHCMHIDATPVYVKLYDKATAPSESDTPAYRGMVPANATAANGAAANLMFPEPFPLTSGLGVRGVTGLADNNDSALTTAEVFINVFWS